MDKLLLTPAEAATQLGIGRSKLYELMRTGTVPSVRIGGCRRVPASGLLDLVARLQTEDATAPPAADGALRTAVGHPQIDGRAAGRLTRTGTSFA